MDVKVDDHVRQLWEVKLDAVEHPSLVRVLKKKKKESHGEASHQKQQQSANISSRRSRKRIYAYGEMAAGGKPMRHLSQQ